MAEPGAAALRATAESAPAAVQRAALALGIGAAAWGAVALAGDTRALLLGLTGLGLGITLQRSAFGFAGAYRRMIAARDMRGVQAQLLLLALTTLLFAPVLPAVEVGGRAVEGAWAPFGTSVAAGAFLFGIGMPLAGGCASGTLYTAGAGSVRMAVVLAAACAGAFAASLHLPLWERLPALPPIVLGERLGWPAATAAQLVLIGALALLLRRLARRPAPGSTPEPRRARWPLWAGAAALALGNLATLLLAGHPWSITWGFTLWGAKAAAVLGWDPASSAFWRDGFPAEALAAPVLEDVPSLMDLAIVNGALCAAAASGMLAPPRWPRGGALAAALLGGALLGYGARIAYGCNIGAFVSGAASGSLHGWLWIACALPGTWLGLRLRPRFGLSD